MVDRIKKRFINSSLNYGGTSKTTLSGTWGGSGWNSMTWVAWVKLISLNTSNQAAIISSSVANFLHFQTQVVGGGGSIAIYGNSNNVLFTGFKQQELYGSWHHVAITAKDGEQKCYLDGKLYSSGAVTLGGITQATSLTVGLGFSGGRSFPGLITDIAVFKANDSSAALSSAQINQCMNDGPSTSISSTLYGYWKHTDGALTTLTDNVSSNNGTITSATWNQDTPLGLSPMVKNYTYSINFNGTTQSGSSSVIDLSSSNKINLVFWFKANKSNVDGTLFEFTANYNLSTGGFVSLIEPSIIGTGTKGDVGYNTTLTTNFNPMTWNKVVLVLDKSQDGNNEIKTYINGKLFNNNTLNSNNTNNFANSNLFIGARNNASLYCGGSYTTIKLYKDYAWTSADVLNNFLSDSIPSSGTLVAKWNCDEGSGTTITDTSGNGYHITLVNTPSWSTDVPHKSRTQVT